MDYPCDHRVYFSSPLTITGKEGLRRITSENVNVLVKCYPWQRVDFGWEQNCSSGSSKQGWMLAVTSGISMELGKDGFGSIGLG